MSKRSLSAVFGELRVEWERARNRAMDAGSVVAAIGVLEAWAAEHLRPRRGRLIGDPWLRERVCTLAREGWNRTAIARRCGVSKTTVSAVGRAAGVTFVKDTRGGARKRGKAR